MASIIAKRLVLLLHRCWLVGGQRTGEDVSPAQMDGSYCSSCTLFGASVRLQAGPYYPHLTAKETGAQESC